MVYIGDCKFYICPNQCNFEGQNRIFLDLAESPNGRTIPRNNDLGLHFRSKTWVHPHLKVAWDPHWNSFLGTFDINRSYCLVMFDGDTIPGSHPQRHSENLVSSQNHFSFTAEEAAMVSCPSKKYFGFIGVIVHGMPSLAFTCQAVVAVLTIVQSIWRLAIQIVGNDWWIPILNVSLIEITYDLILVDIIWFSILQFDWYTNIC